MGILNKIRQKSDNQKKIFSLVSAFVFTFIIVAVWFSFNNDSSASEIVEQEQSKLSSISPVQMIKEEFSKIFSDFNTQITDLDLEMDSIASSSPVSEEIIEATSTASTTEDSSLNI